MTDASAITEIRLFGPLTVSVGGRSADRALTGPARLLLAYLLAHPGRRHRREALIERVWEDAAPPPTRAAFNTTLWRLRRFVARLPGVALDEEADTLVLVLGPGVRCDWLDVQAALASDPCPDRLVTALEACRGPFLEEIGAHWALAPRERAQNDRLTALTRLMHSRAEAGRYDAALTHALTILEADPFREAVHAEAMWLCVMTGQRARAITRHRDFVQLLKVELGIGPMSETTALFRYVLDGLEAADPPARPDPQGYVGLTETIERSRADVYQAIRQSFVRS